MALSNRQTDYSLHRYKCVVDRDENGNNRNPGFLNVKIEKHFLLLDAIVVDEEDTTDRDSNFSQGIDNSLQYIANHPIINILQVASCTAFHNSPNVYTVEDIREKETDVQYLFVLICTNY